MDAAVYDNLLLHGKRLKQTHCDPRINQQNKRISGAGLSLDYTRHTLDDLVWRDLFSLAKEKNLKQSIRDLFTGECVNNTEQRPALHTLLRASCLNETNGSSKQFEIIQALKKIENYSKKLRSGLLTGSTGKRFTDIVNLGIGGSALGGQLIRQGLKDYCVDDLKVHFVANIDPEVIHSLLNTLNPATTLFIICSKSFATQETLQNALVGKKWLINRLGKNLRLDKHWVAVTAQVKRARAYGVDDDNIFPMWDWVGGRYSIFSSVGLSIVLAIGFNNFTRLLAGARAMDDHFLSTRWSENMPIVMGLLSIWYVNVCKINSQAILPYSHCLEMLPAYLQQLQMESNGKSVNKSGHSVNYATCPIVWGGVGTNSQHSFFQLLHQGTHIVPCDFILPIKNSKYPKQHQFLVANCLAQMQALMQGTMDNKDLPNDFIVKHKKCLGSRPSNLIYFKEVTPEILGALIALYEHKTFVESVIWKINPFDQFGVELGKNLSSFMFDYLTDVDKLKSDSWQIDHVSKNLIEEIRKLE